MSEPRWTPPGPWEYRVDADRHYVGYGVCCIVEEVFATRETKDKGATERKANAHLIAAAPDLYEALDACSAFFEELYSGLLAKGSAKGAMNASTMAILCNVALAKARGESASTTAGEPV